MLVIHAQKIFKFLLVTVIVNHVKIDIIYIQKHVVCAKIIAKLLMLNINVIVAMMDIIDHQIIDASNAIQVVKHVQCFLLFVQVAKRNISFKTEPLHSKGPHRREGRDSTCKEYGTLQRASSARIYRIS